MRSTSHTNCIIQTLHKQRLTMMIELMQQELVTRESAAAAAKDVKCIYNCSCFCCRQGCCMVVCSCCTCNTFSCTSYNNRNSSSNISLYRGVSLHPIVVVSTACQSIVAALTLIIGYLTLFKVSYRALWSKAPTNPAAGSATTSNCTSTSSNSNNADSKLKEQYGHGHASYDITNDQQLKTNNLCKMFFNNRKRQRSRRRRRRRRRRRYNNNNSSRQTGSCKQQQYHDSSSDATCLSIAVWTTIGQDEVDSSSNSKSKPYRAHAVGTAYAPTTTILSRWPSMNCSNSNSNSKAKRNRANLLWLLIGIFWLEVKLINCNSIASSNGYVSSIVAQKGCTLCQLEEGIFYSDKHNPHTEYNNNNHNNNNNNFAYKKSIQRTNNNIVVSDRVRLESIKRQILTKLGLTHKPNVSHPLPKQFIWETIYRADGGQMVTNDVFERNVILANRSQRKRMRTVVNELNENRFDSLSVPYIIGTTNRSSSKSKNKTKYHNLRSVSSETEAERAKTIHGSDTRTRTENQSSLDWNKNPKSNAYSESTYLIDINRSRDSDSKNDVSGGATADFDHDDHIYFNDYRVQIQNKDHKQKPSASNNARVKKKHSREHDAITMHRDNVNGFEREEYFGSTQEIITFAEEGAQYRQYRIVEFAAQKAGISNQKISIKSAQMHIRIERQDVKSEAVSHDAQRKMKTARKSHASEPRQRIKIWVFRMSEGINMTEKAMDQVFLFRALFEVDTDRLGWQKFDLTETIREWYNDRGRENLRLLIDCTGCGSKYSLHLFQLPEPRVKLASDRFVNPNRPFLVLHTESPRPRRVRRRAIDCGGALSGQCCKESFYVSFKALGWDDWIIAPRGYFANYCRGECTGPFRTPDTFQTFHAHFIEEYRKMGLLNGMRPCCAPIKFSSMSLIYYGDDGIIKRDLPKMVVDECGCP